MKDPTVYRAAIPCGLDPNGEVNMDSLRATWQFFRNSGQIDGKVTMDDIVDMHYARKVMAALGHYRPASP